MSFYASYPFTGGGGGSSYIFQDSIVNNSGLVNLVNDTPSPTASQYYGTDSGSVLGYHNLPAPGTGTVTSVSVVSTNGLAGTVANATTTPAITLSTSITGLLKGNGTAISAATAGTDYVVPSVVTLADLQLPASQLISTGNLTDSTSGADGISVTGGTGALVSSASIAQAAATSSQNGYLKSTDWSTFNSKQSTLSFPDSVVNTSGSVALSGDSASPGNNYFYGTNGSGTKGWYATSSLGNGFNYLSSNTSVYGGTFSTLSFTGGENTVIGVGAAAALAAGNSNTLIGNLSGASITSGDGNVYVGYDSGGVTSTGSNNTIIGTSSVAYLSGDNDIVIVGGTSTATGSCIAIGIGNILSGVGTTVIGTNIEVSATYGMAFGYSSSANYNPLSANNQLSFGTATEALSSVHFGNGAAAVASPSNVTMGPTPASGSNTAGANFTMNGGTSTGTGAGGQIIFQTAPAGSSGSSANTQTTAGYFDSSQNLNLTNALALSQGGTAATSLAGARTNLGIASGQNFYSSNGTQSGLLFNIAAPGSNVSAGAVYSNNSYNFTVLAAVTTAQSGWVLYTSCSSAATTSGTTLTYVSGTGPATLTIQTSNLQGSGIQTIFNYTTPSNITTSTNFQITCVGAGGGGGGIDTAADAGTGGGGGGTGIIYLTGLSPSTAYYVTIGLSGAGGISTTTASQAGTPTAFINGTSVYQAGGGGGGGDTLTSVGGAGGVLNGFAGFTIAVPGMQGRYAGATTTAAGDGGHSGMMWGAGGVGLEAAGNGLAGTGYGGGGGAGRGAGPATGGAGAGGAMLIEYTD